MELQLKNNKTAKMLQIVGQRRQLSGGRELAGKCVNLSSVPRTHVVEEN